MDLKLISATLVAQYQSIIIVRITNYIVFYFVIGDTRATALKIKMWTFDMVVIILLIGGLPLCIPGNYGFIIISI